jgi:hypothetical protein
MSTPMRRIRSGCCACATTGHAAALPSPGMNARRSLNHLIGSGQQRFRDCEAKGLGGLQVDDQFEFGWKLDWQLAHFGTAQDVVDKG